MLQWYAEAYETNNVAQFTGGAFIVRERASGKTIQFQGTDNPDVISSANDGYIPR